MLKPEACDFAIVSAENGVQLRVTHRSRNDLDSALNAQLRAAMFHSRQMRVAIDCRYIRERPSGIGTYVEALVERLPSLAPADEFHFWAHRLARRPLSGAKNATEQRVAAEPNSIWSLWWPERYANLDGMELFHAAHNTLPRGLPCPSVVTIHDLMAIERPDLAFTRWSQRIKGCYYPQAEWRAVHQARRLIVTTSAMAARVAVLNASACARTVVVPMAASAEYQLPRDRSAALARAAALIGSDAPFLLVVGQDAPHKRHVVALQAFAKAAPKNWRLIFVQIKTHNSSFRRLARNLGIEQRVIWLLKIPLNDLATLYQAARALVQPSNYEGFGIPVVEAMSCGCPVIASDIPTLREVVGGGGALAAVDDVAAFARAIRALAESPSMSAELRAAAFDRSRYFSWDRCARDTLEVFRDASRGTR